MLLLEWTDEQLVFMAQEGQSSAFEALMSRYAPRVFRVAYRMLNNQQEAEDLRQEVFLCAYRRLHSFRGDAAFSTWLYAITVRLCLDRRRKEKRRAAHVEESPLHLEENIAGPKGVAQDGEEALYVQRTLLKLAPMERMLLVLKFIEGLSHEEIAQVLRCSVESSRTRLKRARQRFRDLYQQEVNRGLS